MELDPVKIAIEGLEGFRKEKSYLITTIETGGRNKQEVSFFSANTCVCC
jgi:hypothetical protein